MTHYNHVLWKNNLCFQQEHFLTCVGGTSEFHDGTILFLCQAFNFVLQEIVLFCCTCTVVEFTHAILCTGAERKEAMVGKFCSGGQTENKILGYLLVAESIVIM